MPPTLTIREAHPGDSSAILTLLRELAACERLEQELEADESLLDAALFSPHPRVFCDIAEWQEEPVGYAMWFYSFSTFRGRHGIYLEDLFVRPAHRGRGIGQALLRSLARRCIQEGLPRLEWSVLDWNRPAIEFYRSRGAVPLEGWTVFRLTGAALNSFANC